MAKNINVNTITEEAINLLSAYNVAWKTAPSIRKACKEKIVAAEKAVADIVTKREALIESGVSENEAISKFSCLEENKRLSVAKQEMIDKNKELNAKFSEGRSLVSDDLYNAYILYLTNGDITKFKKALVTFLATIGIIADSEWSKTNKIAQVLIANISGATKATGKSREEGNYVKARAKNAFKDIFVAAFLQFIVKEKGVLDENKDYTLSRHNFDKQEQNNSTTK